jgi:hypothetical protein
MQLLIRKFTMDQYRQKLFLPKYFPDWSQI